MSVAPLLSSNMVPEASSAGETRCRRWSCGDCWIPAVLGLGILVGLLVPPDNIGGKVGWQYCSAILVWCYFFAWSASFYPQVVLNQRRHSVIGLSVDYTLLNFLGFGFYFIYNALLYFNPYVQEEYRSQHDGSNSAVRSNDVMFSGHAFVLTGVTLLQIAIYYDYPKLDRSDRTLRIIVVICMAIILVGAGVLALIIAIQSERICTWLTYIMVLSQVKVVITVCKYCPQVWLNFRRKSTEGWNIYNVILDFTGGLLSNLQLLLDARIENNWSLITGDPVKLLLGNISMVFDIIFAVQHYCLYRSHVGSAVAPQYEQPLRIDA